ncbi:hypothetical protein GGQ68_000721 [Sagittula marina]|uniref:SnoaL-like domain-containing protein n=1 Tax=Sagittula marina TaxID=943940 RepID=A0A7W6DPM5_9RHOB|nr:hypothetical protein [Sagittula marina]MBB3984405.1 hypothetical protein [Sagittula marina]
MINSPIFKALTVAAMLLPAGFAQADAPTMDALTGRVTSLEGEIENGDLAATLDYMPPALLSHLGGLAGTDATGFKEMLRTQITDVVTAGDLQGATYDVELDGAEVAQTDTGRAYALLEAVSAFPGLGVPEMRTGMVALMDDETWYLVRLETPMHGAMLAEVYPDLAGPLDIPAR